MKILMVNKFLYPNGGSETYIFGLGEELVRQGHEVEYFGMEHPKNIVGNRVGSYTANMDFHGGKLSKLMYPFRIIYSAEARRRIRAVLMDFHPDVVHLNNINFQLTPSIIDEVRAFEKKSGYPIRIVFTAHDYQWVCPNHMMLRVQDGSPCKDCLGGRYSNCSKNRCIHGSRIKSILGAFEAYFYKWKKTYRKADVIICPSEFLRGMLETNPDLAGRCVTMHNFTTQMSDAAGENAPLYDPDTRNQVVYIGRYTTEKGVQTLLAAAKKLPEISFTFAGAGDLVDQVCKVKNVTEMGFLTGQELEKVKGSARLVVFPSQWYENCPFTVMEAQSEQIPILCSDMGGAPELILPGETGELFEAGNVLELTEKIKALYYDTDRLKAYSRACVRLPYATLEEYTKQIVAMYRS